MTHVARCNLQRSNGFGLWSHISVHICGLNIRKVVLNIISIMQHWCFFVSECSHTSCNPSHIYFTNNSCIPLEIWNQNNKSGKCTWMCELLSVDKECQNVLNQLTSQLQLAWLKHISMGPKRDVLLLLGWYENDLKVSSWVKNCDILTFGYICTLSTLLKNKQTQLAQKGEKYFLSALRGSLVLCILAFLHHPLCYVTWPLTSQWAVALSS